MTTTLKIFWAEDNYSEIDAVVVPLVQAGWEVVPCVDYETAIEIIQNGERFDFYLVDLILPLRLDENGHSDRFEDSSLRHEPHLGISLIRNIRDRFGDAATIGVFSVVFDPIVDRQLRDLNIDLSFQKGNASNRELCKLIVDTVSKKRMRGPTSPN